eukprot:m.58282 g.58282  ORF g.58282 m.58282 type:complete len:109 (+) comp12164_c0_seq2:54-380(+)
MAGLPSWAKRPELCGQRKHSTSVYASPEIVKPVSSQTSYATHFPARPLPDDPRFVQDSSYVTARHEGSPISCTVRLDGPPPAASSKLQNTGASTLYTSTVRRDFVKQA